MAALKRRAPIHLQKEGGDTEAELRTDNSSVALLKDGARTTQYLQYIKALNTQFTSWVQEQLQEHPHELWQEGIQDYLRHATKIQDDFKDVIGLCDSTKSTGPQSKPPSSFDTAPPSFTSISNSRGLANPSCEAKGANFSSQPFLSSTVMPFSNAAPSGLPFLSIPVAGSVTVPNNGNDVQEEDDALPEPSSPSVKRSEEPGVKIIHELKCKLYTKGDGGTENAWREMGMGNLSVRSREDAEKGTKESRATILVRNEVGRVLLNALLYPNMKMNVQKNSVTGIFHSSETDVKLAGDQADGVKGRIYLIRLKTPKDAEELVEVLTSNAPRAGE